MQRDQYIDWCIQEERRVTWQVTYLGCFGLITIHHSSGSPSFCEESRRFFSLALTNPKEADRSEFSLLPGIMIPVFEGSLLLKILFLWSFHVLVALDTKFCFVTSCHALLLVASGTVCHFWGQISVVHELMWVRKMWEF